MSNKTQAPYPYSAVNGEFFDKEFLDSVWNYLEKQSSIWKAGIDKPNPTDKFAYYVLKQITFRRPNNDIS